MARESRQGPPKMVVISEPARALHATTSAGRFLTSGRGATVLQPNLVVDYGFCYPVSRPCLDCRLLTFRLEGLSAFSLQRDSIAPLFEKSV